jgi:hypothetical protein
LPRRARSAIRGQHHEEGTVIGRVLREDRH